MGLRRALIITFCLASSFTQGQTWNDVSGGVFSTGPATVEAMGIYQGELFVSGAFAGAGGIDARGVARWNGTNWDSLGSGVSFGIPYAFREYNGEMYAGGGFISMGGVANTKYIAKWDGAKWLAAGGISTGNGQIKALEVYNNELYAAGSFTMIGGKSLSRIARWDGTTWNGVGSGISGGPCPPSVEAMTVYNNELYVGGCFGTAGGVQVASIARWNGVTWDSVSSGVAGGAIGALVTDTVNDLLYVGGGFGMAGGEPIEGVAQWDGLKFDSIGTVPRGGAVMAIYRDKLYIAGSVPGGSSADTAIARWDSTWVHIIGPNSAVETMMVYNDELYIGGYFKKVNDSIVNYITRYYIPPPDTTGVQDIRDKKTSFLGSTVPNPAQNEAIIPFNLQESRGVILLYDLKGELIRSYQVQRSDNELRISLKGLAEGTYLYILEVEGTKVDAKRMVIAR